MAGVAEYLYEAVFEEYGKAIREILLNDVDIPYPLYETREAYDADTTSDFKGILVWHAQRYYAGLSDDPSNYDEYCNDVGFFVVPQFGSVRIIPNVEFKQFITLSFDSSSEPDKDPYGSKAVKLINWFINKHLELIEAVTNQVQLPTNVQDEFKPLWSMMDGISDPIYSNSIYIRRNVTEIVRYCRCS